MKSFENFRNTWLTEDKLNSIQLSAEHCANQFKGVNEKSYMATFSATYSLLMLAEYHEWVNHSED